MTGFRAIALAAFGPRRATRRCALLLAVAFALASTGCVTVAEFRKLDRRVQSMQRGGHGVEAGERERLAEIASQLDALQQEVKGLKGRIEVAEHRANEAVREARSARMDAASAAVGGGTTAALPSEPASEPPPGGVSSEEVAAYREAYASWRGGKAELCIDQFRSFLQTYPNSPYADDAAYWMADCYFKHRDYKTAVLRFDDVVARYPDGNKAADALYRQGEALLRLGPGFGSAAGKAFERVLREYPDSARAPEAKKRLAVLKSG